MLTPPVTMTACGRRFAGFSLVELIVTIVIAGILAVVVAARFVGKGGFESRAYFDEAITVVRQAQKVAIAQRRNVVVVVTVDRIAVCYTAACVARVTTTASLNRSSTTTAANCLNDATWLCAGRPAGVSPINSTAANVTFDALGRPSTTATITISGAESGDIARQLVIQPETGYVSRS